jgi:predicted MPP superfamily phosphohydrolase
LRYQLPNRRTFLKASGTLLAAGAVGVAADASIFEPNDPQLVRVEMPLNRLPKVFDGMKIIQLSDFHYDPHFSVVPLRKAIEIVSSLKPDLLVFTGDFITQPYLRRYLHSNTQEMMYPCAELLSRMSARFGCFAVLGNHDLSCCAEMVTEALTSRGINVLINSKAPIELNGGRLWIAGVDDVLKGTPDLDRTIRGVPPQEPILLLAHEPDYAEETAKYPIDLQLSGHSHGGQIRIPGLVSLVLPDLARKFPMGRYHIGPLILYTNVGLGTIRVPIRWNCPPEITLFTLRSVQN